MQAIYYQVDTLTGPWLTATGAPNAVGSVSSLTRGFHVLYAFATDGQEASSVNPGLGFSPIPGQLTSYVFLVTEATQHLPIVLKH